MCQTVILFLVCRRTGVGECTCCHLEDQGALFGCITSLSAPSVKVSTQNMQLWGLIFVRVF